MNKPFSFSLKRHASCAVSISSLLLLVACGGGGGGGSAAISNPSSSMCAPKGQQVSAGFVMANAESQVNRAGNLELILKIDNPADLETLKLDLKAQGDSKISKISANTLWVQMKPASQSMKIVDRYVNDQKIQNVEKDHETFLTQVSDSNSAAEPTVSAEPRDVATDSQMASALKSNSAQDADAAPGSKGKEIIVAVIDTGVDYTHKDLAPYMWKNPKEVAGNGADDDGNGLVDDVYGWDFVNNDADPMADDTRSYHGTHVAGIVKQAAQLKEQGINVKIMTLKYLSASATGRTSVAIQAIDYAIQNGATVLNNSWGSFSYSQALAEAIERARARNVLFIAASGNGDAQGNGVNIDQTPFYPASYPINNIISVAASDSKGQLAPWSNFGAVNVDLSGPGVSIESTRNGNAYGTLSGTSMAAPYISGVAAMIWSLRPDLGYAEVRKVLAQSVNQHQSLNGKILTGGMINRSQALTAANAYVHNPADTGLPEATPSGVVCATVQ